MTREQVEANVGNQCWVNGSGDLAFDADLKSIIHKLCTVVRLSKGGMAHVARNGKVYLVPPRNLDLPLRVGETRVSSEPPHYIEMGERP